MPSGRVGEFRFTASCMAPNSDSHPLLVYYRFSLHELPDADRMEQETLSPRREYDQITMFR